MLLDKVAQQHRSVSPADARRHSPSEDRRQTRSTMPNPEPVAEQGAKNLDSPESSPDGADGMEDRGQQLLDLIWRNFDGDIPSQTAPTVAAGDFTTNVGDAGNRNTFWTAVPALPAVGSADASWTGGPAAQNWTARLTSEDVSQLLDGVYLLGSDLFG